MKALAIIGCTIGGGLSGAVMGLALSQRHMDDFGIAGLLGFYYGGIIGLVVGVVVGSVVFA